MTFAAATTKDVDLSGKRFLRTSDNLRGKKTYLLSFLLLRELESSRKRDGARDDRHRETSINLGHRIHVHLEGNEFVEHPDKL